MSYFSESAWDYIERKISRLRKERSPERRLLAVVPTLIESATIDLASTFTSRCLGAPDLHLLFKIAGMTCSNWTPAGIKTAKQQMWLDDDKEERNPTFYRNLPPKPGKINLVVLCGGDRVTDAGSLADFHFCSPENIWRESMKGSFQAWIAKKMKSIGMEGLDSSELKEFDRLLKPLLDQGCTDLLGIDKWLRELDLSSCGSWRDVARHLLDQMKIFYLPHFSSFAIGKKRTTLSPYIEKAQAFFSYAMFLDATHRDKALRTIGQLQKAVSDGEELDIAIDTPELLGTYADTESLLNGLRNYIEREEISDRERLMQCDFVAIVDKILKFRKKQEPKPKDPLRKLSGGPIEMALHAIWMTWRDLWRDKRFFESNVRGVKIISDKFKHDYEGSDSDEGADIILDKNELAKGYLNRLIGGVDDLLQKQISLSNSEGEDIVISASLAEPKQTSYAKTAEPLLEFSVELSLSDSEKTFRRRFGWRLPEIHSYRLAESLIQWANEAMRSEDFHRKLPVFHLPYYEELLYVTDEEETRRVMMHCIREARPDEHKWTNLLQPEWLASKDPLLPVLKKLADKYAKYLTLAQTQGLHAALFGDSWKELRQAYADCYRYFLEDPNGTDTQMAGMLLRLFLVVQRRKGKDCSVWGCETYEQSAIATILHPAVLEMLEAQVIFLFRSFESALSLELERADRNKGFSESIWAGTMSMAAIHSPLVGLLYNEDQNLDTNVRGSELIHRIGMPEERETTLSTRLLVRYEESSEEEVTDTEMFRESRESKLLFRLMTDYFRLHPHARDGINLAVFRNQDIQPVIAAVHQFVNKLADPKDKRYFILRPENRKPYAVSVTVFTNSGDDVDVARWIGQWQERWEEAETEKKFQVYRYCRFSVAHRVVEPRKTDLFQRMIQDCFEADIAIFYDFIGAGKGGNKFTEVEPFDITTRSLKFPILEKACCSVLHPTDSYKRYRVISNRQFSLCTLHSQVMHRLKNQGVQPGKQFIVQGVGDFSPWQGVVAALHKKAEWVVCIDPNMDERLLRIPSGSKDQEREIIGFGSGVGSHGEANYTISTEQFSLADIHVRLSASIHELYGGCGWSEDQCKVIAKGVLRAAHELSGLSLVRATGVGCYIHDFMAYCLTRMMLREKGDVLCDHLVSLDAYRHWFDLAKNERRPDLLWLVAWLNKENRIQLRLHLIECKVAHQDEKHLVSARDQIHNGLMVLTQAFCPHQEKTSEQERPDQRYWWLQLHRLIASKAAVAQQKQSKVLSALERLAEGDYSVEWQASVFAFWSEDQSDQIVRIGSWNSAGLNDINVNFYTIGSEYVRKLAMENGNGSQAWAEWAAQVVPSNKNVGDFLVDIEQSTAIDEDEDALDWYDPEDKEEEDEEEAKQDDYLEDDDYENTPSLGPFKEPGEGSGEIVSISSQDSSSSMSQQDSESGSGVATSTSTMTDLDQSSVTVTEMPQRILLGITAHGAKPVYWEFGHSGLANRHMLVFGTSGMGKTYAIQCLLSEMGRLGQNSLIIDYTDGFLPSKMEKGTVACLKPKQHYIQQQPLPISPFKAQESVEEGMVFRDTCLTIAKRVASIFRSVYELGNQQFPVLIDAISQGVQASGDKFTLDQMLTILQGFIGDPNRSQTTVKSTISKLKPFVLGNPFAQDQQGIGWEPIFTDPVCRCQVFQFFKVDKHSARAMIEFVLWDLYSFVCSHGNKMTPRVIVLDEVQNLDLGPDAPVAKYLTEGRKHGLALITATQTVKGVGGVSDARVSRLFQAEHKLFFKPTENEMREHAQLLFNAISSVSQQEWANRLASLQIGECWSLGRSLNEWTGKLVFQAQRIRISSLEDRGFHA